ncbi:MAG: right-handed parallel beta-helix repeat-containing protein, partial [Nanoarchaeota archaeon]|nr:right-handed parallel beta-helix repeat-containing protein [Nanoarchaeota archaeon]
MSGDDVPRGIFVKGIVSKTTSIEPEIEKNVITNFNIIQSPNANPSCGSTITTNTVLTGDILNCPSHGLIIGANGINLDCNGFTLTGSNLDFGVYNDGYTDVTIQNCRITDFHTAIFSTGGGNSQFKDNTLFSNLETGFYLQDSGNTLSGNNITDNPDYGIYLDRANNSIVSDNNVINSHYGIILGSSSNNQVSGNNISGGWYGMQVYQMTTGYLSTDNLISNNRISSNLYGIIISESSNSNTILGNTIFSNSVYGLNIEDSNSNTVYNNFFNNTENAINNNGTNTWNIAKTSGTNIIGGPYSGGNFWSNYPGADTDGDG